MTKGVSKSNRSAIGDRFQRLRHVRGFGVHSAFAYRIVTDVVRPRKIYGYYGYHEIDCAEEHSPHLIRTAGGTLRASVAARLLLRLAVALNPGGIFVSRNLPAIMTRALLSYNSHADIRSRIEPGFLPDLTVAEWNHPVIAGLPDFLRKDGSAALIIGGDADLCDNLFGTLREGVMLEARKYTLIFSRSGMQKQRIRI